MSGDTDLRLPDFLIIGAQKSGTTWLRELLRLHPDVFLPPKEVHFFNQPENYAKGPPWYARHFEEAGERQIVGEKTPNYLYLPDRDDVPDGARRIHDLLPEARLIAILRDPVQRAISALNHVVYRGEVSPLHSADALIAGRKRHLVEWPLIGMGMYHRQLSAFFDCYGREQVRVLFFEDDVVGRPVPTLDSVCDFIGVPRRSFDEGRPDAGANRLRRSKLGLIIRYYLPALDEPTHRLTWRFPRYYPRVSDSVRRELYELFEPHNEKLFELLGRRPSSGWRFTPET